MDKKTKYFIAFIAGTYVGAIHCFIKLYNEIDDLELTNSSLRMKLLESRTDHSVLKTHYKTLYHFMPRDRRNYIELTYPESIPDFVKE